MKIISETKTGFLCDVTREEIRLIAVGNEYGDVEPSKMLDADIDIGPLFKCARTIESAKGTIGYLKVREDLEKLLEALTPIEEFVDTIKYRKN